MNIHQKLRLYTINRWGMVEVSRHQSVAEHSYNVALIELTE
jgi:5'-deoxynucleotidase YfbR-like HD superfamily hydrolase